MLPDARFSDILIRGYLNKESVQLSSFLAEYQLVDTQIGNLSTMVGQMNRIADQASLAAISERRSAWFQLLVAYGSEIAARRERRYVNLSLTVALVALVVSTAGFLTRN